MFWFFILGSLTPLIIFFSTLWILPKKEHPKFSEWTTYFSWVMYPLMGIIVYALYCSVVTNEGLAFYLGFTAPLALSGARHSIILFGK